MAFRCMPIEKICRDSYAVVRRNAAIRAMSAGHRLIQKPGTPQLCAGVPRIESERAWLDADYISYRQHTLTHYPLSRLPSADRIATLTNYLKR